MFALFHTIFQGMRKYLQLYNEFIRMDGSQCVFLAEKLTTFIIKEDTYQRKWISPSERVCLTLPSI